MSVSYTLINFTSFKEQILFFNKNKDKIVNLIKIFFTHENDEVNQIIEDIFKYANDHRYPYFFVTYNEMIIGMCFLNTGGCIVMTHLKKEPISYTLFSNLEDYVSSVKKNGIWIRPFIEALCKDPSYKNVGSFLLNNIKHVLKSFGLTRVYLIPESTRYKQIDSKYNCGILNNDKYYESNMQLINYYKSNGFVIFEDHYMLDECENKKFVFLNIMIAMCD